MGPSGRFCRSDNVPQDGDSAGAAAHSCHHPAPNARPRHPPIFAVSNPAMEAEDDPGQSTSENPAANLPSRPEILIDPKTKGECSRTIRTLE